MFFVDDELDYFLLFTVGNVVEIKGRFSVTSENVDLAKVSELGDSRYN